MKKKNNLTPLQEKLLEILKYIDEFCTKNDIEYYAIFGTLIGAIRHQGFIPWDDDIDIAMTKENYDKFCKLFVEENNEKYVLQTNDLEPEFKSSFAKVRDITTTHIEKDNLNKNITHGVYVDIFPIIGVPNNIILKKIQKIDRTIYFSMFNMVIKSKCLNLFIKMLLKLLGEEKLKKISYRRLTKYKTESSNNWFIYGGSLYEENIHNKELFSNLKRVKFENIMVQIPSGFDKILTKTYGDYMKLPPKGSRKSDHNIVVLDLNKPYKEYIKNNQYVKK